MSKIKDALLQADESDISDKQMERWREETRKLDELAEQWNGVYQTIDGVIGNKQREDNEVEM